jgi:hypothetical protein
VQRVSSEFVVQWGRANHMPSELDFASWQRYSHGMCVQRWLLGNSRGHMHALCCGVMVQRRRWGRDSVCAGVHNTCCGGDCGDELHANVHGWASLHQCDEHV